METVTQEAAYNQAYELKIAAIKHWKARSKNVFELGETLHWIKLSYELDVDNGTFQSLKKFGFDSYNQLLSAPIVSGGLDIPIASANRSVRIFRKYCLELGFHRDVISKYNYSKLDQILPVVNKENLEYWLSTIGSMSPGDLSKLVAAKKEDEAGDSEDESITTAIKPGTAQDWLESVEILFSTMKQTFVSPNEKQFIKALCEDFWEYFRTTAERKARASEFKKPTEKLLSAMEYIVKK